MPDVSQEQLEAVTKRVVDQYTFMGLLFTSLDVSNAVKGTLAHVRHREVSPVVRSLFDDDAMGDNYTRTLIDVMAGGARGKPAEAYLYHLTSQSPDAYSDEQRSQLAIPPVSASIEDETVMDPATTQVKVEIGQDGRGRIPHKFMEIAGIKTQRVRVDTQGATLVLSSVLPGDSAAGATVLTYSSPDQLHVPAHLLEGFDTTKPITATIKAEDGVVNIDGSPKTS